MNNPFPDIIRGHLLEIAKDLNRSFECINIDAPCALCGTPIPLGCKCPKCKDVTHSNLIDIINCFFNLKRFSFQIFECLDICPDVKKLQTLFTCILLNDIRNIKDLLTNSVFGLNEIKNEVQLVENQVIFINSSMNNPIFGLNEIKNEALFVENQVILINNSVNNPVFGLNEIKNEITLIESTVFLINNTVASFSFIFNEIGNQIKSLDSYTFQSPIRSRQRSVVLRQHPRCRTRLTHITNTVTTQPSAD